MTREIRAADASALYDAERRLMADFSAARAAQFATGRCLLRAATGHTGPIGRRPNGAPAVPAPLLASLAHDDRLAVACVAEGSLLEALGVDVEPVASLSSEIRALLATDAEQEIDPLTLHVIKEAVFKAWSSSGSRQLAPRQIEVRLQGERFLATVCSDLAQPVLGVHGRWGDRMIAVAMRASARSP